MLRVAVGATLMVHGAGKLFNVGPSAVGIDAFAAFLASVGMPYATFFAWMAGLAEFAGGALIVSGLFTRYAAVLTGFTMVMAFALVHVPRGFPWGLEGSAYTSASYAFLELLASVAIVLLGPGRLALENALFGHELLPSSLVEETPKAKPPAV